MYLGESLNNRVPADLLPDSLGAALRRLVDRTPRYHAGITRGDLTGKLRQSKQDGCWHFIPATLRIEGFESYAAAGTTR